MNIRRSAFGCFVIVSALVWGGIASAATVREKFEKSIETKEIGKLVLHNINGSVEIDSWNKNEVKILADKTVRAKNKEAAESAMKDLVIEISEGSDVIEIETRVVRGWKGLLDKVFGSDANVTVKYRIKIPRKYMLDVGTVNGHVEVGTVGGNVRLRSTNGHIRVEDAKTRVSASTTNGDILVGFSECEKNSTMSFRTINGTIDLSFPEDFGAVLHASTVNGSIRSDFSFGKDIEVDSRTRIKGTINGGGGNIDIQTVNGGIRITK